LAVLTAVKNRLKGDRPELYAPRWTNWGNIGSWAMCPEGTFVRGMQLRDDECPAESADCVALSDVRLFCSPLDNSGKTAIRSSPEYDEGDWRTEFSCPSGSFAVGFEMRVEKPVTSYRHSYRVRREGGKWPWTLISFPSFSWLNSNLTSSSAPSSSSSWSWSWPPGADACTGGVCAEWPPWDCPDEGDDSNPQPPNEAATNMRLYCDDKEKTVLEGENSRDSSYGGDWSGKQSCKTGQYICGLRTQIEMALGEDKDVSGLNNVDVKCCYIVS